MNLSREFQEPLAAYLGRKYQDYFLAAGVLVALMIADIGAFRNGTLFSGGVMVANLGVSGAAIGLLFLGRARRGRRRYAVSNQLIRMPVGGNLIDEWIPLSHIANLSIAPLPPPREHVPASVRLVIAPGSARREEMGGNEASIEIDVRTSTFGLRNLQDLVLRLPDEKLDRSFARAWRFRLLSRNDQ